ncbi:MAG: ABC transporter permease [Chloroflexi bacterium]|nr:ABC transporter permease [Chloroflexota bacterium]
MPKPAPQKMVLEWLRALWRAVNVPLVAVLLALVLGALLLVLSGYSPWLAYSELYIGAFGDSQAWQRTLEKATPLIFSGLAVAFAFKAGLFNIGAQGQLVFGALVSAVVGFSVTGLPALLHIPLAILAGGIAGALYGAIPGALKTYTGAHEVITTIMLNYIALNITDYLANGPFKDTTPGNVVARTPRVLESAQIGSVGQILGAPDSFLGSVPFGFILAILVAAVTWWLLWRTTLGYEIRTVGQNADAAKYAGMKVARTVILTMILSGFLAGMGGAVETQGVVGRFQPGFNVGLGFDGITIALLGKTSPIGVIPAAILVGAMNAGATNMQFRAGVDSDVIDVIQAIILFFVAAEVIVRWLIRARADDGREISLTGRWGKST